MTIGCGRVYRLAIVEDEMTTRHGLESYIPWEKLGFEVANTFEDGLEALEWLKVNHCDVVLTDIMMLRMNGLELAAHLNKIRPNIKVVILSGYSSFSYAKQAIQSKVVDYLLKPIDEDDLMRVFSKLKIELDSEAEEKDMQQLEKSELMWTLQTSFLKNLLSGQINTENELNVYLRLLKIDQQIIQCPILAFEINLMMQRDENDEAENDEEDFEWDEVGTELRKHFVSQSGEFLYFVLGGQGSQWNVAVISLTQGEIGRLKSHCREKVLSFIHELNSTAKYDVSCELTHAMQRVGDLIGGISVDAGEEDDLPSQEGEGELYEKMLLKYKIFIVELDLENIDQIILMIDDMMRALVHVPFEQARFIVKNLYSMIALEYGNRGIDVWDITEGRFDSNDLYQAADFEGMMSSMKEAFRSLQKGLKEVKAGYNTDVVGLIIQYIENNIAGDLGSDVIAKRHHIHPAYMSRMFKQKTGERLSDYILRVRMEKAVELLKDGRYKVLEISQMVGCRSSAYFSTLFRKYTGYSPSEYCYKVLS